MGIKMVKKCLKIMLNHVFCEFKFDTGSSLAHGLHMDIELVSIDSGNGLLPHGTKPLP